MRCEPVMKAEVARSIIEPTVRTKVPLNWSEKIIRTIRVRQRGCLLTLVTEFCQIPIDPSRDDLAPNDRLPCWEANHEFSATMIHGPSDCARGDLGLKNRRHRLWFTGKSAFHPVELRRVQGRQVDHREMDVASIVNKFRSKRVGKSPQCVFRCAVG